MLGQLKTWTLKVSNDTDAKVELSPPPKLPVLAGVPVTDIEQLEGGRTPARLLLYLARQRVQQPLARVDVATDNVPAAGKQRSIPTPAMYEHLARLI